jgi:ATP-dependent Lhr-like helicase
MFGGDLPAPHDEVVARMRAVYMSLVVPEYLDATAVDLLAQGRTAFDVLGLRSSSACMHEGDVLLFPWVGDRVLNATALALHEKGCTASPTGIAISISSDGRESLIPALRELASSAPPDPIRLARRVPDAIHDKFDRYLEGDLLAATFASSALDTGRVPSVAADLLARLPQGLAPKG